LPKGNAASLNRRAVISTAGSAWLALPFSSLRAEADVRGANEGMPRGEKDINRFLADRGFGPLPKADGLSPIAAYIGTATPANIDGQKRKERAFGSCLLVRFLYPSNWLIEVPNLTDNGEAGNIGANNYQKGDSANFAAVRIPSGKSFGDLDKEFFKSFLSSQMTNDVFEDVKVKKITKSTADGSPFLVIDWSYSLLTRAGFSVQRKGVASAVEVDGTVVGLVTATTDTRFKELEPKLRASAESFRASIVSAPLAKGSLI